ncbi:MAG: PAS domain S-box protein [Acidobacteria bacterium]|nr:PAS domain S-box protein [Acidobacteriota bacterium]
MIDPRTTTEEHFRQAHKTLQAVIDAAPAGIYTLGLDGRVESWSLSAERLFGWTEDEVLGRELPTVPDAKGETRAQGETRCLRKDGAVIDVAASTSALRDSNGVVTSIVVVATDVTEQRRLERELVQARQKEAVGRLAGGVAHDFNNLLTIISGYSQLLLCRLPSDDDARAAVEAIANAADRAAALTKQFLALSRRRVAQPPVVDRQSPSPGGMETILLVEDDTGVRRWLAGVLEQEGYTVVEAVNGREALTLSASSAAPIHLLITGLEIPGEISGGDPGAKLTPMKVLYTCGEDALGQGGALRPGLASLAKPFTAGALARKVREVLNGEGPAPASGGTA